MDWEKQCKEWLAETPLIQKFPLAGTLWVNWANKLPKHFRIRDLYDFFDKYEIFVHINPVYNLKQGSISEWEVNEWHYGINTNVFDYTIHWFKTRVEAEGKAFMEAFGVLEEKLESKA